MKGNQRNHHNNRRHEIHIPDEMIERIVNDMVASDADVTAEEDKDVTVARKEYEELQYRSVVLDVLGLLVTIDHGNAAIDLLYAMFNDGEDDDDGGEEA